MNPSGARKKAFRMPRQHGITLLELMIVVVIVGILAAIAYPSYQSFVERARRADAQTALMELAQFMERHYTSNATYLTAGGNLPTLPFNESPKDGGTKFYDLSLQVGGATTATAFVVQAVPKPASAQAGDPCGTMTLSNTGVRTAAEPDCWRR